MNATNNIAANLVRIKNEIAVAKKQYQRVDQSIALVVVSKTRTVAEIMAAYNCGQLHFGENYLQEALPKITAFKDAQCLSNVVWHYLGRIQANKTKAIAQNFSWVQSLDDIRIATKLNAHRPANLPPLNVCIQVNISNEPQKNGIMVSELPQFVTAISQLPNLKLRGLMVIPAVTKDFDEQYLVFQCLAQEFQQLQAQGYNLDTLSMGMSADFVVAIAAGSTMVRIGTAVFSYHH